MENLAPAGNRAALEKADAAGADAVYLGYSAFSARAGAGNFDREELEEAIRYAHARHMRVHVTVNTLIKDAELSEVWAVLRLLQDLRADAVLVQDLGVLRIARACFPELTVHASTQMAIHNRTGAAWCGRMGIRRVVLARECSLAEIRRCRDAGPEIEVFAHGAQCVAVSGLCLFSSMAGERSGNRGRCAQPCRMAYRFRGQWGAWLSPRDLCLRDELPQIAEAGAASIKLEGRLKRPEYVAVVTASYRKGLDSLEEGRFRAADPEEKEGLLQIFNRGGFMKGYAMGTEDAGVIYPEAVNHQGIRIGTVTAADGKLARVKLEKALRNGDGLEIRGKHAAAGLVYAGPDQRAGETALLRLRAGVRAEAGDAVVRLTDARQMAEAAAMKGRTVPADMALRAMAGEALTLEATDGESRVTVRGETVEAARTRAVSAEELVRCLEKTGGTLFAPRKVTAETEGAFIPVSRVNEIRRQALKALEEARIKAFEAAGRQETEAPSSEGMPEVMLPESALPPTVCARTKEQADAAREAGWRVIRYPEDYRREALEALGNEMRDGEWLRLPDVCEEETLQELRRVTEAWKDRLGGVVLGTVGQLGMAWPVPIAAGSGIPVMNRQAAALLSEAGCVFMTASPELTGQEVKTLREGGAPIAVTVYGRTRLMLLHHCPARTALGLEKGHAACRMCDGNDPASLQGTALEDRKGYRFPLLRQRLPEGCLVQVMNTAPTDLMDRKIAGAMVEFTTETGEEAREVLRAFAEGRRAGGEETSGHWKRPVE